MKTDDGPGNQLYFMIEPLQVNNSIPGVAEFSALIIKKVISSWPRYLGDPVGSNPLVSELATWPVRPCDIGF